MNLIWSLPLLTVALVPPEYLAEQTHALQVAVGEPPRWPAISPFPRAPAAEAAWTEFLRREGGQWSALWDDRRNVPLRVYGSGIPAPGASRSESQATQIARAVLGRHLALLAPGSTMEDFELVSNDFDRTSAVRTVGFVQHHRGLEVRSGALSVRIKNDRLFVLASEAVPHLDVSVPDGVISEVEARLAADRWIRESFPDGILRIERVDLEPSILPWQSTEGPEAHAVVEVVVRVDQPIGRWSVFVDAVTGARVARQQTLRFADGALQLRVPERHPGRGRIEWPAPNMALTLDGEPAQTDAAGRIAWPGTADVSVTAEPTGSEVRVTHARGPRESLDFTLSDGDTFAWTAEDDEFIEAQLTTFIAASTVKEYAKRIAPDMAWLREDPLIATVNLADTCNAFSDGVTINFYSAGARCQNTGRIPDVVYHEFGHSFHAHAIIRGVGAFDVALSEGAADYLAATITGDPATARGFFYTDDPLRHIDPGNDEFAWPSDISGDPHITGLIFAGAMWDLRKILIDRSGDPEAAVRRADHYWHQTLRRASSIPTSYVEVLVADDDDGDLANGTPNFCDILAAFERHGLATSSLGGAPVGRPRLEGSRLSLAVDPGTTSCRGASVSTARVLWQLREDRETSGTIELSRNAQGFLGDLPSEPQGQVLQYSVEVELSDGTRSSFPINRADRFYETFLGPVVPLYCTDFERDPAEDGWTSQLLAGVISEGANDWRWGSLDEAPGSGDPTAAFSGERVFGNDLGGGTYNGLYQPDKRNIVHLPTVSTRGYPVVRLQYRRWLTVEDGDFDQAEILSNGQVVWANFASGARGSVHHEDREWRFHDVDLTDTVRDGVVQLDFRLSTDGGLEFGGWTLDDLCVVGYLPPGANVCGNGTIEGIETCDDGNQVNGDGCEANCRLPLASCGNSVVDEGETCDDGNQIEDDGCQANCVLTPPVDPCAADPLRCLHPSLQDGSDRNPTGNEDPSGACACARPRPRGPAPAWLSVLILAGIGLGTIRRRSRGPDAR